MGAPISRNMCCSIRDKDGFGKAFAQSPHFNCSEVELPLESPSLVAFSPLWAMGTRRLAVANAHTVHIYRMSDSGKFEMPTLESTLEMEDGFVITALIFRDEDTARAFVIASKPENRARGVNIKIWPGPKNSHRGLLQEPCSERVSSPPLRNTSHLSLT
ncbi:unnamed protein product [Durusdinium trenchii]|uniref:Uncharacterized protein n=1 Tax=Durusdinium trenchii TaxID=1381693 RepID=A0ABP0KZ15_9DINO